MGYLKREARQSAVLRPAYPLYHTGKGGRRQRAAGGDPVIPEENTVEPVPQQNGGDGGAANSQEIDALF